MRLVTFQPMEIYDEIERNGIYYPPENKMLGKRVFCLKVDKDTMVHLYHTAPSMPQVMFIMNVPDNRVEEMDYVKWVNTLNGKPTEDGDSKYREYCIKYIEKQDIEETQIISNSSDANEVQDAFMNKHYRSLEKESGYRWYRLADRGIDWFWDSVESVEYIRMVTHAMMPEACALTEEHMDFLVERTKEIFIKAPIEGEDKSLLGIAKKIM